MAGKRERALEEELYRRVKKEICRKIFQGVYQDGDRILPERQLSEKLGVSRVTVRRALQLLEEEHIIQRVQGSGTRIALHYGERKGDMEIVTLVAPAQNAFFSNVIDAVETRAEEGDSLVLFKQKPPGLALEKCLFQLYEKNLRNVLLWQEDMELSEEFLKRLKGLGMNLVLFDTNRKSPYADSVCLDNHGAVSGLLYALQEMGCKNPGYVGWDDFGVQSVRAREEAFLRYLPKGKVFRVPWRYRNRLEELPISLIERALRELEDCDAILYGVSELGLPFEKQAALMGIRHRAAMIDHIPGWEEGADVILAQDFTKMAEKIFHCLEGQNGEHGSWRARLCLVKGTMIKRQ